MLGGKVGVERIAPTSEWRFLAAEAFGVHGELQDLTEERHARSSRNVGNQRDPIGPRRRNLVDK